MKKNLYIVFGRAHTGKSTLIRNLVGLFRSKSIWVRLKSKTNIGMTVYISSAQEMGENIVTTVDKINRAKEDNILMSIRVDAVNFCPTGQEYYDELIKHFNISDVAILGEDIMNISDNLVTRIKKPLKYPPNKAAKKVRNSWGWV